MKEKRNLSDIGKNTRFSSTNQPKNRGRKKGKTISEWLQELGIKKSITYKITLTNEDGKKKTQEGKVESETTLNELIAVKIITKAISGDHKYIKTWLERVEGKSNQKISLSADEDSVLPQVTIFQIPDNNRD